MIDEKPNFQDLPAVTEYLQRWSAGSPEAIGAVFEELYGELHRIAERAISGERRDHTLQATAIVHEAFLRFQRQRGTVQWESRGHFLAFAARVMRQLLTDYARGRARLRRGGGDVTVHLDSEGLVAPATPEGLLDLDLALDRLAKRDPQKGTIVELRFFAGLSREEIAEVLGLSPVTVSREWRRAKGWLLLELGASPAAAELDG